jgi:serine/threonine-protein kinase
MPGSGGRGAKKPAESAEGHLEIGAVIADKYRIDRAIGEGGMGMVYAATNTLTGKSVALKWMLPKFAADEAAVARFLREARAAGMIDHANVVNIYDVGRHGETPFIVMELLRGRPLDELLGEGRMAPSDLVRLLIPAMRGIAAAHARGIVHRDLKPENIFVQDGVDGRRREAKVLDFGISKAFDNEIELHSVTRTGAIVGTPHYMSPEQVRGKKDLDTRTDVYSIGVILYEGLTGELPYVADTFTALAVEIATGTLRRPRELVPALDPELEVVVLRALARDPRDRFPDVASFARALEPFGNGARFGQADSMRPGATIVGDPRERHAREHATTLAVGSPSGPTAHPTPSVSVHLTGELVPPPSRTPPWIGIAVAVLALVGIATAAVVLSSGGGPEVATPTAPPARPERPAAAPPVAVEPAEPPQAAELASPPAGLDPPAEATPPPEPARTASERARPVRRRIERATTASPSPTPTAGPTGRARGVRTGGVSVEDF